MSEARVAKSYWSKQEEWISRKKREIYRNSSEVRAGESYWSEQEEWISRKKEKFTGIRAKLELENPTGASEKSGSVGKRKFTGI